MAIRKLKNGGRRKAAFGESIAAAGILAATQVANAALQVKAQNDAAKLSAATMKQGAKQQSDALKDQALRAKEDTEKLIEANKEQNAEQNAMLNNIQLQLAMNAGAQGVNDRYEASRITAKDGTSTAKRKGNISLRGNYYSHNGNLGFKLPHGGAARLVRTYPQGDLYDIWGEGHDKGGVDMDFADGNKIEAEGHKAKTGRNKHKLRLGGNQLGGEYMFVTPDNAYFISQHDINGDNPAELIDNGVHPLTAYAIQEYDKAVTGKSDDGSPVAKNGKRLLRNGGKCRRKALSGLNLDYYGTNSWKNYINSPAYTSKNPNSAVDIVPQNVPTGSGFGNFMDAYGGALLGAAANVANYFIGRNGTNRATNTLINANREAGRQLSDTLRNLPVIDVNEIKRGDYTAAHMMPVLQAPVSFTAQPLSLAGRSYQRQLSNIGKYSSSGAAALDRYAIADVNYQDIKNKIYSTDQQQLQAIRQANAERETDASKTNAMLDAEALKSYYSDRSKFMELASEQKRENLMSASQVDYNTLTNIGQLQANATQSNANLLGSTITGSAQGFINAYDAYNDRKYDLAAALLGADSDSIATYYSMIPNRRNAIQYYNGLLNQYRATTNPSHKQRLARQINNIASRRGLAMV